MEHDTEAPEVGTPPSTFEDRYRLALENSPFIATKAQAIGCRIASIFDRGLRVLGGITIGIAACFGINAAFEILSRPIVSMSILDILGGLGIAGLSLAGVVWAISVAYGDGRSASDFIEDARRTHEQQILQRLLADDASEERRTRVSIRKRSALPDLIGSHIRRSLPAMIAIAFALGVVGLGIYLLDSSLSSRRP